ncbi:hemin-degrading factor [Acerihabitans arboris]|uniref:Hemin-degrading factor n=1 Tax=Acerihabitans arboris TaxID=2691583 RepID=A0A845SK65_9GAMM|nr:ChuX/HutX family heme-like substrate-binding protein [Acerihabitans arboris]NDL65663.1 hemin-degrading factor [Acerihabitans arboris]
MNEHYQRYLELKQQHPKKYARELAQLMNISEAELAWARVGHDALRLNGDMPALLEALAAVGETKSITRNEYAVHEQIGRYDNLRLGEHAGLILNPRALDLRLFVGQWYCAFALIEQGPRGESQSVQIFDYQGDAVLKIYITEHTGRAAWDRLLARFAIEGNPALTLTAAVTPGPSADTDHQRIDLDWRAMTDVHQFFPLLKRHGITRQQAFRAVGDDLARQVDNRALNELLHTALKDGNEIMIFVGNRGCVQIYTGIIEKVVPMEKWINIFNRQFTLHLVEEAIAETWVTRKPTRDGMVTSLELFAHDGTQIAQLFGQRTEGQPEQTEWRRQIAFLTQKGVPA